MSCGEMRNLSTYVKPLFKEPGQVELELLQLVVADIRRLVLWHELRQKLSSSIDFFLHFSFSFVFACLKLKN